jgi:hypothetical protein
MFLKKATVPAIAMLLVASACLGVGAWRYRRQRNECREKLIACQGPLRAFELQWNSMASASLPSAGGSSPGEVPRPDDLEVPANEDREYLAEVIQRIFPEGQSALSEQEKCLHLLRFVVSHHRLESNAGPATKIIRDGRAYCGGLAHVFKVLARSIGVPARYVGIFHVPDLGAHALCEVYYGGQWRLYDPTLGIFFCSKPDLAAGEVLSLQQLLASPSSGTMMKVVAHPWTGVYDDKVRRSPVTKVDRSYLADRYERGIEAAYQGYFRIAFPVACGQRSLVSFPIYADLIDRNEIKIGGENGDCQDVVESASFGARKGAHYLGDATPIAVHTLFLRARAGEIVEMEYVGLSSEEVFLFPLAALRLVSTERDDDNHTVFRVMPTAEQSAALISCADKCLFIDSIRLARVQGTSGGAVLARQSDPSSDGLR